MSDRTPGVSVLAPTEGQAGEAFEELLERRAKTGGRIEGVLVGRLVGFMGDGDTPLVVWPGGLNSPACPARATLDLHADHIGRDVVLVFEEGDPCRPIVIGCLHNSRDPGVDSVPGCVELDRDGQRMLVSAQDQMVLKCGKASITLTRSGKVIVQGTYISSRSSGVLRIKGGSVQIN